MAYMQSLSYAAVDCILAYQLTLSLFNSSSTISSSSFSWVSCKRDRASMPHELVGIGIENDVVFALLLLVVVVVDEADDEVVEALLVMLEGRLINGERVMASELAIRCRKLVGGDGELDSGSVWPFAGSFALGFLKVSKRNMRVLKKEKAGAVVMKRKLNYLMMGPRSLRCWVVHAVWPKPWLQCCIPNDNNSPFT